MKVIYLLIILFQNTNIFAKEIDDSYFYIDSDKLNITKIPLVSEFIGNAYARNGENHFWGERILIDYDNDKKIKLITIIENVKIKRPDESILGDKAIYEVKLEKIKIIGNVSFTKDGNTVNGDELTVDLINSTSIIKGNKDNQVSIKVTKQK